MGSNMDVDISVSITSASLLFQFPLSSDPPLTLCVCDDGRLPSLHGRHRRVRGSQIDTHHLLTYDVQSTPSGTAGLNTGKVGMVGTVEARLERVGVRGRRDEGQEEDDVRGLIWQVCVVRFGVTSADVR